MHRFQNYKRRKKTTNESPTITKSSEDVLYVKMTCRSYMDHDVDLMRQQLVIISEKVTYIISEKINILNANQLMAPKIYIYIYIVML